MIDTKPQVTAFIRENFTPATKENAIYKLSTKELLEMLFKVFPENSIDDYDLFDILTSLNYKPFKISGQSTTETDIQFVWCLKEID